MGALDPHRPGDPRRKRELKVLHQALGACTLCPKMIRPVVHGAAAVMASKRGNVGHRHIFSRGQDETTES